MTKTELESAFIQRLFLEQIKDITLRTTQDIYSHEALEEMSENDCISSEEEGFMEGYLKA